MKETKVSKILLRGVAAGVTALLGAALVVGVGGAAGASYDHLSADPGVDTTDGSAGTTDDDDDTLSPPTGRYWR